MRKLQPSEPTAVLEMYKMHNYVTESIVLLGLPQISLAISLTAILVVQYQKVHLLYSKHAGTILLVSVCTLAF